MDTDRGFVEGWGGLTGDGGSASVTKLQPEDHDAFFSALDNPPEPTDRLRRLFEGYGG